MTRRRGRGGSGARSRRPVRRGKPPRAPRLAAALVALALAGALWWRLAARPRPGGGGGLGLDPEEANQAALRLARAGQHLEAIPYFREVARQDPRSSSSHQNLASALGNAAQQARTHLGKTDNVIRSSVERIAMIRESLEETVAAERLSRTDGERVLALLERGRELESWGFPLDALAQFRTALSVAPARPDVQAAVRRAETELATGER